MFDDINDSTLDDPVVPRSPLIEVRYEFALAGSHKGQEIVVFSRPKPEKSKGKQKKNDPPQHEVRKPEKSKGEQKKNNPHRTIPELCATSGSSHAARA